MKQYLELCRDVLENGKKREDRTGVGTTSVFGRQLRFDLKEGFPLLTTKKVYTKGVVAELLWFLSGDTNIRYLTDNNVHIWDAWADDNGDLGRVYGAQWRRFRGYMEREIPGTTMIDTIELDQMAKLVHDIKNDPTSRRHIVVAFNPIDADKDISALPACHSFFQFYVDTETNELDCQFYMRSNDVFLGLPFNIASYALLTHLVARATGLKVGELVYSVGDCHIYNNHIKQIEEQLTRTPKELPQLVIDTDNTDLFSYKIEDFKIIGYNPDPAIKGEIAV